MRQCTVYDDTRVSLAEPNDPESWVTKRGLNLQFEKREPDKWVVTGPPDDVKIMKAAAAAWEKWDRLITRLYAQNYAEHDRIDAICSHDAADRATAGLRKTKAAKSKAPTRKRAPATKRAGRKGQRKTRTTAKAA